VGGGCVAGAQRTSVIEWQGGVAAALARRDFWGAELGAAWRPGKVGQTRVAAAVDVGDVEGAAGLRVGATAQFMLRPAAGTGPSPYAGLGLAVAGARGVRGAGYLTALLGVEAAPGRRRGWFAELGVGGGVRAVAGWRWRRGSLLPS